MSLRLYHQVGHIPRWNIDSFETERKGNGLILSPVHQTPGNISTLSSATRAVSYFDPQFYLPSSQKSKLQQYDFFPDRVAEGFETSTFEAHSLLAAERCVAFQLESAFAKPVIPTRFIDQMYSSYIDRQRSFSVEAFIERLEGRPSCISIAVTAPMIVDEEFRTRLLNWITSYQSINEIHLTYSVPRETKQILDVDFLAACHSLGREVLDIGLQLVWCHQNTEALLFTAQGDVGVTMGSFENTRMFSIDKFVASEDERRAPKARIFLPGLLNWIQFDQAKEIRQRLPEVWEQIHRPSVHSEQAFDLVVDPAFNQPYLYKHYFCCIADLVDELDAMPPHERAHFLSEMCRNGLSAYRQIANAGIDLERHGRGAHLAVWATVLSGLL